MTSACPACGHGRSRCAMTVRAFRWRRCAACRSLFVENPPPREVTAALYRDEGYFAKRRVPGAPGQVWGYQDYLGDRAHIERKFRSVLVRVEPHVDRGELLDVGAGPGLMLAVAKRRGWEALGLEPNAWAAAYARDRLEVDVRTACLGALALERDRFGAVTMMDLLEHVPSPQESIAEAARLTRPGGLLAVLTPDAGSVVGRLMGGRWPELLRAPAHLVLFSVRGLSALVECHGYRVLGWHSVGKTSRLSTLLADASPAAPRVAGMLRSLVGQHRLAERELTVDPRTKFCLYARLEGAGHRRFAARTD